MHIYIHTVYMFVLVCYRTLCGSSWKSWRARRTLRQSLWDFNFNVGLSDNKVHKVPISIHWLIIISPTNKCKKNLGKFLQCQTDPCVSQKSCSFPARASLNFLGYWLRVLCGLPFGESLRDRSSLPTDPWKLDERDFMLWLMVYTLGHDFGTWSYGIVDHHITITLEHDFWITGAIWSPRLQADERDQEAFQVGLAADDGDRGPVSGVQGMGVAETGSGDCGKHVQEELQCRP